MVCLTRVAYASCVLADHVFFAARYVLLYSLHPYIFLRCLWECAWESGKADNALQSRKAAAHQSLHSPPRFQAR